MNQHLTKEQNQQLESIIEGEYPESILSIDDLAFKLHANEEDVENVLIALTEYKVINPLFILKCDNDDFSKIHTYRFYSMEELSSFVKKNIGCRECDSALLENNVEVYFQIPTSRLKKVNDYE